MRLYLAAAWSRKEEIREIAEELNAIPGIKVGARWLFEPPSSKDAFKFRRRRAIYDRDDVRRANTLVRFTDDLTHPTVPARLATGARMFEMGYAYALGKKIIVVGGYQPIFDYLPGIVHVYDVEELKKLLTKEAKRVGIRSKRLRAAKAV